MAQPRRGLRRPSANGVVISSPATSAKTTAAPTPKKSTTPLKRAAASPPVRTPRRQSKRIGSTSGTPGSTSTPKKSVYFEHNSEESGMEDRESEAESEIDESEEYEDPSEDDESAVSSPEASEDESEEYNSSDEDDGTRKRRKGFGSRGGGSKKRKLVAVPAAAAIAVKAEGGKKQAELWREGAKVDVEGEVFIKLPKARGPGKIPYADETLHPNTLLFLGDLKRNNQRTWLKMHDADFRQSERDFKSFVEAVTEKLTEKDETIPELPPKDLVFRIYRDVRFSSDPTPYKTHFSAAWSRTGRKGPYAAYYVQVAPGGSFVGGGLWCPEAEPLGKLRRAVDRRAQRLKDVLLDAGIRKEYLGGVGKDEKKAVKAFCGHNSSNALKRHPKDYTEDHPSIELLRLRNYTIGKKLKDDEVLGPGGLSRIVDLLGTLTPFVTYLNGVVMPDPDQEDSDDDDDEDEEDGDEGGEE